MTKITDTTEVAKYVREQLKKEFPAYKFSVTSKYFPGGSELNVALMAGPVEVFADNLVYYGDGKTMVDNDQNAQLNPYTIANEYTNGICNGRKLTPEAWTVLHRVAEIAQENNWDNSDSQSDYFDVNYYFHLDIGKWNKDYQRTA